MSIKLHINTQNVDYLNIFLKLRDFSELPKPKTWCCEVAYQIISTSVLNKPDFLLLANVSFTSYCVWGEGFNSHNTLALYTLAIVHRTGLDMVSFRITV